MNGDLTKLVNMYEYHNKEIQFEVGMPEDLVKSLLRSQKMVMDLLLSYQDLMVIRV